MGFPHSLDWAVLGWTILDLIVLDLTVLDSSVLKYTVPHLLPFASLCLPVPLMYVRSRWREGNVSNYKANYIERVRKAGFSPLARMRSTLIYVRSH